MLIDKGNTTGWFKWGRGKLKPRGMDLIDSVAGRFDDMVLELEEGISQCQEERNGICSAIDSLRERDSRLSQSSKRAETIANNLRVLLGTDGD
jgi:hypothetical protein